MHSKNILFSTMSKGKKEMFYLMTHISYLRLYGVGHMHSKNILFSTMSKGRKEMFYLMTHISYLVIWRRTYAFKEHTVQYHV